RQGGRRRVLYAQAARQGRGALRQEARRGGGRDRARRRRRGSRAGDRGVGRSHLSPAGGARSARDSAVRGRGGTQRAPRTIGARREGLTQGRLRAAERRWSSVPTTDFRPTAFSRAPNGQAAAKTHR